MAQYILQVNATDSYIGDTLNSAPIRGGTELTAHMGYGGMIPGTSMLRYATYVAATFPSLSAITQYNKKRYVSGNKYVYVISSITSATADYSGDLVPPGNHVIYPLSDVASISNYDSGTGYDVVPASVGYVQIQSSGDRFYYPCIGFLTGHWTNVVYHLEASYTISSHTGANPPYMKYTFEDVLPYAANLSPSVTGNLPKHASNTLSWKFAYDASGVVTALTQKSAKFRWRPFGTTPYTEIAIGTDQFAKIPAETFTTDFVEWQVVLTSDDNNEGAASAWIKVSTLDAISTPTILYPNGEIVDGSIVTRFTWDNAISTNTIQTNFDLQYSPNAGVNWLDVTTQTTSNHYYDVPANTIPTGNILWRVRTYNTDNIAGNWSTPRAFISRSAPQPPVIISETITSRPNLVWQSTEQQTFQVVVGTYDSGSIYSVINQFALPIYLADGTYTIKVRVQNTYGFWSEWGERTFILSTSKPTAPTLSVISNYDLGLRLAISYTTPKCILYRREFGTADYYSIATLTTETEYTDFTVASGVRYEYFARAVNSDNSFADCDEVDGSINLYATYIANVNNLANPVEFKLRLDVGYGREHTYSKSKTYSNFVGREYPTSEINGTKEHTLPQSYFVKSELYKPVMALLDADTVLYRNELGENIYGSIDSISEIEKFGGINKGYLVSLALRQIDYQRGGELA